jgi:flagellar protein FlaG
MSRIDANIATQIGDAVRPPHTVADRQSQVLTAQVQEAKAASAGEVPMSSEDMHVAAAQLKQVIEVASGKRLSLNIDAESEQAFMQVIDLNSGEIIKQIPSKEVRMLHARLQEFVGMLLDKHA